MKNDVRALKIREKELKKLTGIGSGKLADEYTWTIVVGLIIGTLLMIPFGIVIAAILGFVLGITEVRLSTIVAFAAICSYPPLGVWIVSAWKKSRKLKKRLTPLLKEVQHFNNLVGQIETLDQLAEVGNPVKVQDRNTILTGLRAMREQLVRALKTERILRDKPEFESAEFSLDLAPLYALEFQEQTTEYNKVLQDTLQIGENIQNELKKIYTTSQ
jgi:hypothetical protein